MPNALPLDSVGIVKPHTMHFSEPLLLACGKTLNDYQLVYETYGQLNANKSNAILICHALSGHHHAAGYHSETDKRPGWWDAYIGPNKPIDTNKFYVVALNNIGGCHGSTGQKVSTLKQANLGEPISLNCVCATGCTAKLASPISSASTHGQLSLAAALAVCKPCVGHLNTQSA